MRHRLLLLTESEFWSDSVLRQFACDRDDIAAFLQRTQGGDDCHLVAERLLLRFGDVSGILAATMNSLLLVEGVLRQTADIIVEFGKLNHKTLKQQIISIKFENNFEAFRKYILSVLHGKNNEHLLVIYFDVIDKYIGDEIITSDEKFAVNISAKTIVKKSILTDAAKILIAHNHPSGDPNPSQLDVRFTRELLRSLKSVEIDLLDHFIVSNGACMSMRLGGWI